MTQSAAVRAGLLAISIGLTRGAAAIYPLSPRVSDPLSQAMALTAIVIGLAVTSLLLVLEREEALEHESEEAAAR